MAADDERETAAAAAADVAMRAAVAGVVGMAVQIGGLLALSWAISNRETVKLHARRAMAMARRDRTPGNAGQQLAEHAADVALIAHAGGELA